MLKRRYLVDVYVLVFDLALLRAGLQEVQRSDLLELLLLVLFHLLFLYEFLLRFVLGDFFWSDWCVIIDFFRGLCYFF